jgi:four helix bundle protein
MNNFRGVEVWQKARLLAREVYSLTRSFPRKEMFGLTQQMRRAAISIISNIAEGKGRHSRADYRSFLVIARASAFELDAQTIVAQELEFIDSAAAEPIIEKANEITRMLNAMIKALERSTR